MYLTRAEDGDLPAVFEASHARIGSRSMRAFDVIAALALLLFLAPLMLLVALAIMIFDPGPVIFRHQRIGFDGRSFYCLKFRTMVVDAERRLQDLLTRSPEARAEWALNQKLGSDPRITALGRFLRKSSLDELPQLFNILSGEMSLVGPRPIVHSEVHRYGRYFCHYVSVRPGLTGLWQVSGRNDTSYRTRVAMDVVYARQQTLALNVLILAKTVPAVVLAKGCS